MYICLCNGMTETRIRKAVADGARRTREVYESCGGRAQCGTCTGTILCLLRKLAHQTDGSGEMIAAAE